MREEKRCVSGEGFGNMSIIPPFPILPSPHPPCPFPQVRAIKRALPADFPLVSNGNVRCAGDVTANQLYTGADGIMSAEGLLDDPTLFNGRAGGELFQMQNKKSRSAGGSDSGGGGGSASSSSDSSSSNNSINTASTRTSPPATVALEYLDLVRLRVQS